MRADVVAGRPFAWPVLLRAALVLSAALAGVWLASLTSTTSPAAAPPSAVRAPAGPVAALTSLPLAAQAPVSNALGRADRSYWIHDHRAVNPLNRLAVRFGDGSVTVAGGGGSVRLRLVGSGAPRVDSNRAVYQAGAVRAQYANGPLGLEQSFTLERGASVTLALGGSLRPVPRAGGLVLGGLRYTAPSAVDARGRRLAASIALHGNRLVLSVDPRGAVYPVKIDPFVQAGDLNESPPPQDAFGYSSAVSGSTIAVGAPAHQVGSNDDQGAVFVFTEPPTGWASSTSGTMLTASSGTAHSQLGYTVATNGSTIVAGAPGENGSVPDEVYVFVEQGGTWGPNETTVLTPPGATTSNSGSYLPVAISPDGNTIATGMINEQVGANVNQGEAYAFTRPPGGWGSATPTVADFTASDGAANDVFGLTLAASDTAIAVTGGQGGGGSNDEAVYVFTQTGGVWATGHETAKLSAGDESLGVGSGSLAISPDAKTIVAGDPVAMVGSNSGQGEAFVFAEPTNGGGWSNESTASATLTASDGAAADDLGFAAGASDSTVVLSAPSHQVGGVVTGAAYVFDEPSGGWTGNVQQTQELDPATTKVAEAGYSLGFDGTTIVAGSRGNQQGEFVFVPQGSTTTTNPTPPPTTGTSPVGSGGGVPTPTSPPIVSGTGKAGQTLVCSTGTWTGSPTAFSYQWYRDGTPIAGATSSKYVVQTSDEGLSITCTATASSAAGTGTRASSGAIAVKVPKVKGCPAATGSLAGKKLGLVHLGMTRARARHAYAKSSTRGKRYEQFFCLTPIGVRVGYGSHAEAKSLRGKVIWVSTASAYYAVHRIRVGATIAAARAVLKLSGPYAVGRNNWYLASNGSSNAIFKVRSGLIQEIGIANRKLTSSRAADRKFLRSFS